MRFYNVRKRETVEVPEIKCKKVAFERKTMDGKIQERYAVRAIDEDGTKLTKFIPKEIYETLYMETYDPSIHDVKKKKGFFSKLLGL